MLAPAQSRQPTDSPPAAGLPDDSDSSQCLARALAPQVCDTLTGTAVLQRRASGLAAQPSRCGPGAGPRPLPEDSDGPAAPPLRSPTPPSSAISSWPAAPRASLTASAPAIGPLCRPAQRTRCNDGSKSDLKACLERRAAPRSLAPRALPGPAPPCIDGSEPMQNDQAYFFSNIFLNFKIL
jgi:hypothetical protein